MRWLAYPLGVAAVVGALIALTMPVSLGAAARSGSPIACGTALSPDLTTARHEDSLNRQLIQFAGPRYHPSHYADECDAIIALKRRAGMPVAALGGLVIAVVLAADVLAAGLLGRRRAAPGLATAARLGFPATPVGHGGAHP